MRWALSLPVRRPGLALAIAAGLTALAALGAARLRLDSSYFALLDEEAPYVVEANAVRERTGGHRQLVIALTGLPDDELDAIAEQLAERAAREPAVAEAYATLDTSLIERRALWRMEPEALERLVAATRELAASARRPAFGPDGARERRTRREAIARIESIGGDARRPPLDLRTADGRYRLVLLIPRVRVMDMARSRAMMTALRAHVDDLARAHPGLEARFTGKFALVLEHDEMLQEDLLLTGGVAIGLCLLLIAAFFRSWRAPPILGLAIVLAAVWTLGLAGVTTGSLNAITTLLLPVLAGLGVDFGIHLTTRYEQLRARHPSVRAMREAIRRTFVPALTGAVTTAAAFATLGFAELRAFVELGGLTAAGVLLSLGATYLVVPALLVLRDRGRARPPRRAAPETSPRGSRRLAIGVVALCLGLAALALGGARELRFENDYRLLREDSDSDAFFAYVGSQLGMRFDPSVLVVEDPADLARVRAILERRLACDGRLDAALGLDDFLPRQDNRPAIEALRAQLDEPMLELAGDPRLDDARRVAAAQPWTVDELPAWVRRRFTTRDGAAIVLLYGDEPIQSDAQALRWDAEVRSLRAELSAAGVEHAVASEALLPAQVYRVIVDDGPRLVGLSAAAVALLVLVHFVWRRGPRGVLQAALVLAPLAVGLGWALGLLGAAGVRLTMFNLVVFPCAIGIGVDDLVHLAHHHRPGRSIRALLSETGPAVLLTSLTTAAGFGATLLARHPGLANVGPAALVAVACTTVAALILLPALLAALHPRTAR